MESLKDRTIKHLVKTFIKSGNVPNEIPVDACIDFIKRSSVFETRMVVCEMARLPIESAYENIDQLCRIKLLEMIVPFLLHMNNDMDHIEDLDVVDVLKAVTSAKHATQEKEALEFLEKLKDLNESGATHELIADDLEEIIDEYLNRAFFIDIHSNRLKVDVDTIFRNVRTGNQHVRQIKLFHSDVTLRNILDYMIGLDFSYGIMKVFIIENTDYLDHVMCLSFNTC